jgi:uncharacterized LabA/DUF88 family protein
MDRSASLIDGNWLEKARLGKVSDPRWDLEDFSERLVPKHHWRFRTYYFDALPYLDRRNPTAYYKQLYQDKEEKLNEIDRLERFTVRRGYCKLSTKEGYPLNNPQSPKIKIKTVEQKMVDVLLATEMTRIAWSKEAFHIELVAGDGDYVAAVEAAKDAGAIVRLFYIRTQYTSIAPKLYDMVDERIDLTKIFQDMEAGNPIPPR